MPTYQFHCVITRLKVSYKSEDISLWTDTEKEITYFCFLGGTACKSNDELTWWYLQFRKWLQCWFSSHSVSKFILYHQIDTEPERFVILSFKGNYTLKELTPKTCLFINHTSEPYSALDEWKLLKDVGGRVHLCSILDPNQGTRTLNKIIVSEIPRLEKKEREEEIYHTL